MVSDEELNLVELESFCYLQMHGTIADVDSCVSPKFDLHVE